MKKWLIFLVSVVFVFCLSGCNGDGNNNTSSTSNKKNNGNTAVPSENNMPVDETRDGKKTLVVSILGVNDFYKQAKQKYEETYPNTTIQFKEFPTEGATMSPAEVEKYIKQTTTEVLSGKGADLFVTNSDLPIEKFINKQAFVNLDEMIEKDNTFDANLYQMNILDNSRMNHGLYILPLTFYLQALYGDAASIESAGVIVDDENWTWTQFAEISKQLAGKGGHTYSMGNWPPDLLINNLVSDNYTKLINGRTASFDSAFFMELLKQVKSLYDDKVIKAEYVDFKDSNFAYSMITSPSDYLARLKLYYENGKVYQKPHSSEQKSGISFDVVNQIAMNSNSKVKGEAWNFMKFLMSEEMQSYPQQAGFSINKSVNDKVINELAEKGKLDDPKGGGVPIAEKDLDAIRDMVNKASLRDVGYNNSNNKIQTIISEEVNAFFSGQKSAEDVAKLIQNRVMTYLNE